MVRRGRPPHPDILTPRESEVLDLLRQRLINEQIAERLGITLDGAKYHVSQILSKLGVSTREEAAAWQPTATSPWWQGLIALPVAARIFGAFTLIAAAAALAVLAWGVAETGGPSGPSDPPPTAALADCKDSTPVQFDGHAACSFTFEAKDVPARLTAGPVQIRSQPTTVFGDIILYATCAPAGSCQNLKTGEPVTEERTSQVDWRIVQAATIVITSPHTVESDSIPVRKYRFVDLAYDHAAEEACPSVFEYCSTYSFFANYEQLTSGIAATGTPQPGPSESAQPTPNISSSSCVYGTPVELDGRAACSLTFDAKDVPARLEGFPVQVRPERCSQCADIKLHATCAPEGSCVSLATGETVTEQRTGRIDWKIVEPATIKVTSYQVVVPESVPAKEYRLVDFAYDHPAGPICTDEFLCHYVLIANYERVK